MDKDKGIKELNDKFQGTMMSVLGIEITDFGENHISGKMPVDHRTKQPFGLLHGGASAAFAETLGSMGAGKHVDLEEYSVVGVELNSSHLSSQKWLGVWESDTNKNRQNHAGLGYRYRK